MKKKIIIAAMMAIAITAQAQTQKYNNGHKYDLLSNLEIGISGQYSYALAGKAGNWGADIRMTKRLGNNWRLRGIADINGFGRKENYDRYAKAMVGLSADFLPFYMFADYGLSYNPTAPQKFNPAGDAGIGLHFDIGRGLRFYTEVGADRTAHGNNEWSSDAFVKVGYAFNLGITESDRKEIEHDQTMRSEYGELKRQNTLLKSEMQKCTEAGASMQAAAEQMQQMVISLQSQCQTLEKEKKEMEGKAVDYSMFKFHFNCASAVLSEIQESRVATLAAYINSTSGQWRVDGYASPEGSDYNNMVLSQQRAEMVCEILEANGVSPDRLIPIGNGSTYEYGEDSPLNRMVVVSKVVP